MVDVRGGIGLKKYREARVVVSAENADRVLSIVVPRECSSCGFGNFNICGTVVGGRLRVEVRCMRCGKANDSLDRVIGASSRSCG
jgi:hypothetical protein